MADPKSTARRVLGVATVLGLLALGGIGAVLGVGLSSLSQPNGPVPTPVAVPGGPNTVVVPVPQPARQTVTAGHRTPLLPPILGNLTNVGGVIPPLVLLPATAPGAGPLPPASSVPPVVAEAEPSAPFRGPHGHAVGREPFSLTPELARPTPGPGEEAAARPASTNPGKHLAKGRGHQPHPARSGTEPRHQPPAHGRARGHGCPHGHGR